MQRLNATISPLVLRVIEQACSTSGVKGPSLGQAIIGLSRLFTKERAAIGQAYLEDPVLAAAYLRYFLPVNLSKIQVLLDEMPVPEDGRRFSVLDLGSGPGTGALAVLDWWQRHYSAVALSVVALDTVSVALRQTGRLWNGYCHAAGITTASLRTCEGNLERRVWLEQVKEKASYDLVILANCLNELYVGAKDPIGARTGLVAEAFTLLAPHGTMMIVEPALRDTSRSLQQVRDRLLQEKRCTVYSPCLHENSCPALINPHDWCHEERTWETPESIQQIDEEVGFIKDALKFSYLLLRQDGKTIVERRPNVYRVVSELREMKGEKRAWLCNEQGRQEVGRQDRLASPQNEAFDQWHRGAIVQIERITHKEQGGKVSALGRIEQDVAVKIIRSV
ncbi:MAG TPA: small ribosomal subunit Rsm22 family protein [Nitrospira sp.]|nr:small ribosomal subunit Rsm22 family protein [Nitrospira sp.]